MKIMIFIGVFLASAFAFAHTCNNELTRVTSCTQSCGSHSTSSGSAGFVRVQLVDSNGDVKYTDCSTLFLMDCDNAIGGGGYGDSRPIQQLRLCTDWCGSSSSSSSRFLKINAVNVRGEVISSSCKDMGTESACQSAMLSSL